MMNNTSENSHDFSSEIEEIVNSLDALVKKFKYISGDFLETDSDKLEAIREILESKK